MDGGVPCADVVRACRDLVAAAGPVDGGWARAMLPFSQALGPLLAFVTIVIGWGWVSRDNNKRESRKEIRANLNDIRTLTLQIEVSTRAYFQKPSGNEEAALLSITIKRDVQYLAGRCTALKACDPAMSFDGLLAAYRRCVTGNDFDSKERPARPHTDMIFLEIGNAGQCLIDAYERAFAAKYR
jgi:hypothetical protein